MSWENKPMAQQVSIFKCENGFGVEMLIIEDEDTQQIRRYIAPTLMNAFSLAEKFFGGELDG